MTVNNELKKIWKEAVMAQLKALSRRVLPEKLIVAQLFKKCPALCEFQRSITAFIISSQFSLS
jgi:hypothetical protein